MNNEDTIKKIEEDIFRNSIICQHVAADHTQLKQAIANDKTCLKELKLKHKEQLKKEMEKIK